MTNRISSLFRCSSEKAHIFSRPGDARGRIAVLRCAIFTVAAVIGVFSSASGGRAQERELYRGFTLTFEDGMSTEMAAVVQRQIDKVLAVGLPPNVVALLRTVPVDVLGRLERSPGHYGNRRVALDRTLLSSREKPVLLHEFMHAFHQLGASRGPSNPEINAAYARAEQTGAYNSSSHMMSNVFEYFATTSTTYLYGATAQEPFNRQKLLKTQPDYYRYLARLFGPGAGHYPGRLN